MWRHNCTRRCEEADASATQDEVLTLWWFCLLRETTRKMSWDNDSISIHNALTFKLRPWASMWVDVIVFAQSLIWLLSFRQAVVPDWGLDSSSHAAWGGKTRRGQSTDKHSKKPIMDICPRLGSQRKRVANWLWDTFGRYSWPRVA